MKNETLIPELRNELLQQLQIDESQLDSILENPIYNRVLGCFFGATIGDALGSHCEFQGKQSHQRMEKVMTMPGGGTFPIKPGQLTDDTELALHCLEALQSYDPNKELHEQVNPLLCAIATDYIGWLNSNPFDIGITCKTGFSLLQQQIGADNQVGSQQMQQHLERAFNKIKHANHNSLSNGYLMRIAPIAMMMTLIKHKKSTEFDAMVRLAKGQINMTHGNNLSLESGLEWVNLLSDLSLRHDDVGGIKQIFEKAIKHQEKNDQLWSWKQAGIEGQLMDATLQSGFAKIAFSYGFNRLKWISEHVKDSSELNSELYKNSVKDVIQRGGDTDTNAAIVGGLIGCIVGFTNLPQEYLNKQLALRLKEKGSMYKRPEFYEPFNGLVKGIRLIKKFL